MFSLLSVQQSTYERFCCVKTCTLRKKCTYFYCREWFPRETSTHVVYVERFSINGTIIIFGIVVCAYCSDNKYNTVRSRNYMLRRRRNYVQYNNGIFPKSTISFSLILFLKKVCSFYNFLLLIQSQQKYNCGSLCAKKVCWPDKTFLLYGRNGGPFSPPRLNLMCDDFFNEFVVREVHSGSEKSFLPVTLRPASGPTVGLSYSRIAHALRMTGQRGDTRRWLGHDALFQGACFTSAAPARWSAVSDSVFVRGPRVRSLDGCPACQVDSPRADLCGGNAAHASDVHAIGWCLRQMQTTLFSTPATRQIFPNTQKNK